MASPTVLPWKSTPLWDGDDGGATMATCPGRWQGWQGSGSPCPYVISWALSWGFFLSSSDSRQCRKLSRVTSGLGLTVILSLWFHTSRPIRATRRRRGWYSWGGTQPRGSLDLGCSSSREVPPAPGSCSQAQDAPHWAMPPLSPQ
uniref:Uncharacterized protein n=1 Tax=Geospiza parvula TaxID=87175 RepID=A0A8C3MSK9_GEOPR